jgi:archaeal flagellar protein FlaH
MVILTDQLRLSTSGVKEIASVLDGGIDAGSLVLIEGEAETGKSVLAQYLAYDAVCSLKSGAVYYTTDMSVKSLLIQMKSISLNMMDYFLTGQFQITPVQVFLGAGDNSRQLRRLLSHIRNLNPLFNLVLLDALTPLFRHNDPKIKLDFVAECKELCQAERSIILVIEPYVIDEQLAPRLLALADYHLTLKTEEAIMESEKQDRRIFKTLEVTKAHGAVRIIGGRVRFDVLPGTGIHIVPYQDFKV